MVFSSLLFLFLFLTLQMGIYVCLPPEKRNMELLIFSLIFYAWGGPVYLLLIAGETAVSWYFGRKIGICRNNPDRKAGQTQAKHFLVAACVLLLGLLAVFKYLNFICANLQAVFHVPKELPNIVLPIGISFYTFQLLSYVADVYRGDVRPQQDYHLLLLYASLFHQCIAGPIVRYETVANEIQHRRFDQKGLAVGIRRFSIGLAKKAILANGCAGIADTLLPSGTDALAAMPTLSLWLGACVYMLQIYLDFSAYSDMAIGLGQMVGFHYLENFNYPYIAYSVQDFWKRWHISLSTFFRDYVYIPLGGSRCSTARHIRNLCIVWFLTGLWHGASWNYIFWGLYYLLFLLLEHFVIHGRMPRAAGHIYTLLIVLIGWVIFRFEDLGELKTVLRGMFTIGQGGFIGLDTKTQFFKHLFFLIFACIACTPLGKYLHKRIQKSGLKNDTLLAISNGCSALLPTALLILSTLALVGDSYNPFLYFQF